MSGLPGIGGWDTDWEKEIAEVYRKKQKEYNKNLAKQDIIFVKADKVHIKAKYFEELAKQMKHKVSIAISTFPKEDEYYVVSSKGYLHLQKYIPLPPWEELKIRG